VATARPSRAGRGGAPAPCQGEPSRDREEHQVGHRVGERNEPGRQREEGIAGGGCDQEDPGEHRGGDGDDRGVDRGGGVAPRSPPQEPDEPQTEAGVAGEVERVGPGRERGFAERPGVGGEERVAYGEQGESGGEHPPGYRVLRPPAGGTRAGHRRGKGDADGDDVAANGAGGRRIDRDGGDPAGGENVP
jgi:hypothetical protein